MPRDPPRDADPFFVPGTRHRPRYLDGSRIYGTRRRRPHSAPLLLLRGHLLHCRASGEQRPGEQTNNRAHGQ